MVEAKEKTTNSFTGKGGLFIKKPFFASSCTRRAIKSNDKIDLKDEAIITKLYEALVPGDRTRTIDVEMIMNEAMPAFEKTLGTQTFTRFKKFIGLGVKNPQKNALKPGEYQSIVNRLRTIENAQYYICGYKEVVSTFANKLVGAPEDMSDIVKAKVLRMFLVLLCGYYYFVEDFQDVVIGGEARFRVNIALADQNNKKALNPEELTSLLKAKFKTGEEDRIYYETIMYEFEKLDKNQKSLVLAFSELEYSNGKLTSSNVGNPKGWTFGQVRQIKQKIFKVPGIAPMEMFACEDLFKQVSFSDIYTIYKILKTTPIETFPVNMRSMAFLEGSRFVNRDFPCYEFIEGYEVTGEDEIERYLHLFDFVVTRHIKLISGYSDLETKQLLDEKVDSAIYYGAIKFAVEMNYLSDLTLPEDDLNLAVVLVTKDGENGNIQKYLDGEILAQNLKELLAIDDEFEKEAKKINSNAKRKFTRKINEIKKQMEIEKKEEEIPEKKPFVEPEMEQMSIKEVDALLGKNTKIEERSEVNNIPEENREKNTNVSAKVKDSEKRNDDVSIEKIISFADCMGYGNEKSLGIRELITNVIIPCKENAVERFVKGELSQSEFEEKLGLEDEFEKMYFDLEEIDVAKIENKLMEFKRKMAATKEIRQNALLIHLYVYIVEGQIACGKKHKVLKRNKSLKPQNLLALVD